LRARLSAEEAKSVDDRWEDAPVTFGPSASRGGGAPGVVARIRAVLRR
jgi:hypothetical protein